MFSILGRFINECEKGTKICVKFCLKTIKTTKDDLLDVALENKYLSRSNIVIWLNEFKIGREAIDGDPQSGRLLISMTNKNIVEIRNFVRSGHRLAIREMVDELTLSFYSVWSRFKHATSVREKLEILSIQLNIN